MARKPKYSIEIRVYADISVVCCKDTHYHSDCITALGAVLSEAEKQASSGLVIVDLTDVVLFSSAALRALRATHLSLKKRDGRIVAAGGGELALSVLKFAPFIEHFVTLDEALAKLSVPAMQAFKGSN
ncbi:MAG: hypothetical protein ACPGGK_09795 [Pikeienuella sp.]